MQAVPDNMAQVAARGVAESALQNVQAAYHQNNLDMKVNVMRFKGKASVVATENIRKSGIVIPVAICAPGSLVSASTCRHPRAVRVVVKEMVVKESVAGQGESPAKWPQHLPMTNYMVTPEVNLPKNICDRGGRARLDGEIKCAPVLADREGRR